MKEKFMDFAEDQIRINRTNKLMRKTSVIQKMNSDKKIGINLQKEILERDIIKQFKYY
jgi:hypothetical protein